MPDAINVVLLMLLQALLGAFGTAFVFEHTGRDVSKGGIIGLVLGGTAGWLGLIPMWVWLFYRPEPIRGRALRRRWYTWWRF
jgi:hypothetical protein